MSKSILFGILQFVLIAAFQIFILNGLQVGYFNPLFYIWFVLLLPTNCPKILTLVLSFAMGLTIDIFSGVIGFHAMVATFIGFIRGIFITIFFEGKDTKTFLYPCAKEMNFAPFVAYVSILVLIHHFLYFIIEEFTFREFFSVMLRILCSSLATIILIVLCDFLFIKPKKSI